MALAFVGDLQPENIYLRLLLNYSSNKFTEGNKMYLLPVK